VETLATEKGIVTKLESATAWVTTTRTSACETCTAKSACRTLGGGKEMEVEAINLVGAKMGDWVVLGFETSALVKISFLVYIVPIISMIIGALIGQKIALSYHYNGSVLSAIMGFLFFFLAFLFIKSAGNKMAKKNEYQPKIIRIIKQ
jgi:sigma-E factor negative regulatory protein RseC